MADSVSDRFSVLKDHAEKLLLQETKYNSCLFWQAFGAFYPCRHLMFWALQCLQKECNHNPCNWSNIALIVRFELLREDEHDLIVLLCRILHYDLRTLQAYHKKF